MKYCIKMLSYISWTPRPEGWNWGEGLLGSILFSLTNEKKEGGDRCGAIVKVLLHCDKEKGKVVFSISGVVVLTFKE